MGMGSIEIELLIHEHSHKPITGEVLAIGRQHISSTGDHVLSLLEKYGVDILNPEFETMFWIRIT
ncbi:hypothetical protein [Ahrensia sp. R2A130]|uniref:hypothetical protein n=1 Tax=Ahrensia sp. R2A130 TaxID=744979 RepID=UPI0001E0F0ED|nr:hypothetical protein [Ahrensia sp. R2A130]EFL89015.1 10 kDa chaperonin [Ahrensia sp. R2A130]